MAPREAHDLPDREYPDPDDWEEDSGVGSEDSFAVVPCPACGEMIYEDAQQCPHCKEWIIFSKSAAPSRAGWWFRALVVGLVILGLLWWIVW